MRLVLTSSNVLHYVQNLKKKRIHIMEHVNKATLVSEVSKKAELPKTKTKEVIDAVVESITKALADGEKVQLIGFGTFEVRERAARKGRNPQTGKPIKIAATKVPAFKPGKALKDTVK